MSGPSDVESGCIEVSRFALGNCWSLQAPVDESASPERLRSSCEAKFRERTSLRKL